MLRYVSGICYVPNGGSEGVGSILGANPIGELQR